MESKCTGSTAKAHMPANGGGTLLVALGKLETASSITEQEIKSKLSR